MPRFSPKGALGIIFHFYNFHLCFITHLFIHKKHSIHFERLNHIGLYLKHTDGIRNILENLHFSLRKTQTMFIVCTFLPKQIPCLCKLSWPINPSLILISDSDSDYLCLEWASKEAWKHGTHHSAVYTDWALGTRTSPPPHFSTLNQDRANLGLWLVYNNKHVSQEKTSHFREGKTSHRF